MSLLDKIGAFPSLQIGNICISVKIVKLKTSVSSI